MGISPAVNGLVVGERSEKHLVADVVKMRIRDMTDAYGYHWTFSVKNNIYFFVHSVPDLFYHCSPEESFLLSGKCLIDTGYI